MSEADQAPRKRRRRSQQKPQLAPDATSRPPEQGAQSNRENDRGWRELAGSSPSQVGVSGAMRARDIARPSPDHLAAAERDLQIVHRNWQPPEDSATSS